MLKIYTTLIVTLFVQISFAQFSLAVNSHITLGKSNLNQMYYGLQGNYELDRLQFSFGLGALPNNFRFKGIHVEWPNSSGGNGYYRTFEAGVDYVYFAQDIGLSYKLIEKNSFDLFFGVNYQLEELIQHSEWGHETSNYNGAYANENPDFLTSQTTEKFNAVDPSTLMNTIVVRMSPRKKIGRLFIQADFQLGYVTSQRIFHESYFIAYYNKRRYKSNSTLIRGSIGFSLGYYFGSEIE